MMRPIGFWIASGAIVLALTGPAAGQRVVPHEAISQQSLPAPTAADEQVGFKADAYDRMTVPVMVAGTGPYRFLVDTGADRTAVSREIATGLKLEPRGPATVHTVVGAELVPTVRVPLIELGPKRVERLDAPMFERRHMSADGILGVDSLRSQRLLFDFRTDRLSIVPTRKKPLPVERGAIVVQAKARKGHLILTRGMVDDVRVNLIIDTGAEVSIANGALRRRLGIRAGRRSSKVELLTVTGGEFHADWAIVHQLDIGGAELGGLPVLFGDAHIFKVLELDDRPALLLGMNALRAFDLVSIDFAQRKLRVVLPPRAARMASQRRQGLRGNHLGYSMNWRLAPR